MLGPRTRVESNPGSVSKSIIAPVSIRMLKPRVSDRAPGWKESVKSFAAAVSRRPESEADSFGPEPEPCALL